MMFSLSLAIFLDTVARSVGRHGLPCWPSRHAPCPVCKELTSAAAVTLTSRGGEARPTKGGREGEAGKLEAGKTGRQAALTLARSRKET